VLSAYESALLARFAAASLVSLVLSLKQLNVHNNSGSEQRIENYVRLLRTLILSNAVASLIQLSGAIIVSGLSLAGRDTSAELRRGVFIVSFRLRPSQKLIYTRPALLHSCCVISLFTSIGSGVDSSYRQVIRQGDWFIFSPMD
jgi:hypothetical protein